MSKLLAVLMLFCLCAAFGAADAELTTDGIAAYNPDKPLYQWSGWPPPGNMWLFGRCYKVRVEIPEPPPPRPDDAATKLIKVLGGWAVYVALAGFLGMLLAAFLLYRGSVWWDDCAVASTIAFCGGSALAYNFKWFVYVATASSVGFLAYAIYAAIRKKRLQAARDQAIDTVEVVKALPRWDDAGKKLVDSLQDDLFRKHLKHSEKTRNGEREAKIRKALEACTTETKATPSS